MNVRLRRLVSEYARLQLVFEGHDRIGIVETIGRPPEKYLIEYQLKGLVEENNEICERNTHRAEITLGPGYPREMPRCVMLTPVFHPNIDHLAICTEDIGSAGQTLDQTIIFIGQMICFQAYNLQSPRNGDAARWTSEHLEELPLENVDLVPHTLLEEGADFRIATAATEALATLAAEAARPLPVCANCGTAKATVCVNGHLACADCLVRCANCLAEICVLCPPLRCAVCKAHACDDCGLGCTSCGNWACLAHLVKCVECGRFNCSGCAAHCRHTRAQAREVKV
jgi:ubiquitin-protein ligase